jgi:hypothetical protein
MLIVMMPVTDAEATIAVALPMNTAILIEVPMSIAILVIVLSYWRSYDIKRENRWEFFTRTENGREE